MLELGRGRVPRGRLGHQPARYPAIRRRFYGFDIDSKDNVCYGRSASCTGASKTIRYGRNGTVTDSFATGIGSKGAAFH